MFKALRSLAVLAAMAAAIAGNPATASSAAAQAATTGTVKSKHGAWAVVCDHPAGASSEQCALLQNVVSDKRPEISLSVVALKTADGKARILRVLAPLGVLLPLPEYGLGLIIDGKSVGRTQFTRCFADGCYAEVPLDDNLLKLLENGKEAVFTFFQSAEKDGGIGIQVDLNGFKDGFEALK
ncbi:invasion associated locus B family protein [Jiella sp. MQZ9-1]|uniref:Invasion associated locus B family protein n=1 Tax=Jiella flava TaxID=2816857 RepID=A0A939JUU3_9HYPH|nr:invasion associated locus B family protein [Jiella flava]MBO0663515.1 invasion associated locus B family protein [Jiella flava]MCD2472090.1 invasion associated locus B family protein [Jiella flava]